MNNNIHMNIGGQLLQHLDNIALFGSEKHAEAARDWCECVESNMREQTVSMLLAGKGGAA